MRADDPIVVSAGGGHLAAVEAVHLNPDGSGYLKLDGGRHLNFEAAPANVAVLRNRTLTLTSSTVLLGVGVGAPRIAERLSPRRIRFVGREG